MFNLPDIENKILAFWQENKIFQKTLAKESPKGDFVFYDGPPFATGTPHYGHIVASLMKDIVPRYFTMRGYRVERKWGWDCHGLPIENIVEKELRLKSKKDIEELGIAKFNQACQSKVLLYADEWRRVIDRLGRWVDMDNDYKTMDLDYMESIWWVFKELYDQNLIYEGRKSMHICPRCATTLSQSEVSQGYLDIEDLSLIAKFKIKKEEIKKLENKEIKAIANGDLSVLAWTTTPWTLPGNVALAVGEDIDYSLVKIKNPWPRPASAGRQKSYYLLAKANVEKIMTDEHYEIIGALKGRDLVGLPYEPLFPYFDNDNLKNRANGFKIYAANFVTIEDGTGVVHIAPAFGEDDMNLGEQENLPFVQHVSIDGRFTGDVCDFAGLFVKPASNTKETDQKIIDYLQNKDLVFRTEKYVHSYPHCWRCDTPLLNYATSSWFVAVTKIKDKAIKLAEKINWTPAHIKEGRFGKWLEGARDWSISRQRYWGSVMPIWACQKAETRNQKSGQGCDHKMVIGSIHELEELSGQKITNLHKHIIDEISFSCPKCGGTMRRIPDVLDCWLESGSMPYAEMHYPFENKEKFEANFPAEFIAEGVDQTRTWFYYMHILATALKGKPAFKNVIANGIVLAANGKKMSKRLNNYPDPALIFEKYGADPLRFYLAASPVMRAEDLNFTESDLAEQSKFFNTLFNVLSFYKMFKNEESEISNQKSVQMINNKPINVLDKWLIAKLHLLIKKMTSDMDSYNLSAVREIPVFIDELSTWYIRRSRDRFKGTDEMDKLNAQKTLHYVLLELSKLMAPFMPFTAEYLYKELSGRLESVHLADWPEIKEKYIDDKILNSMNLTRQIVELGLSKRAEANIKVRQPLNQLTINNKQLTKDYENLIKDELNIKEIKWQKDDGNLEVELDLNITEELKAEGLLRELVRTINQERKKLNLTIHDKIVVEYFTADQLITQVFSKFANELKKNVLATELRAVSEGLATVKINGVEIGLKITLS